MKTQALVIRLCTQSLAGGQLAGQHQVSGRVFDLLRDGPAQAAGALPLLRGDQMTHGLGGHLQLNTQLAKPTAGGVQQQLGYCGKACITDSLGCTAEINTTL